MGKLFYNSTYAQAHERSEETDINVPDIYVAITLNINPFKKINRKLWYTYTREKQIEFLLRLESKFRFNTPSIKLEELQLELAPSKDCVKFRNMHIHALYKVPNLMWVSEMKSYFSVLQHENFKHLHIEPTIYDKKHWLIYIRKDII